jgi:glutaredoxin
MNPSPRSISVLPGIVMVLLMAGSSDIGAQQYRWTDDKGRVQYTDTPPPASAKNVQKKNLTAGKNDGPAEPYALQIARKGAPVKLYTAPECGDCDDARKYLNKRGIPFTEISVVKDSEVAELKALSGRAGVPVMLVGGSMQRGFTTDAYDAVLDAAGYPKSGLPVRNQVAPVAPVAPVAAKPAAKPADNPSPPPAAR